MTKQSLADELLSVSSNKIAWWKRISPEQQVEAAKIREYYRAGKYHGKSVNQMAGVLTEKFGVAVHHSSLMRFFQEGAYGEAKTNDKKATTKKPRRRTRRGNGG